MSLLPFDPLPTAPVRRFLPAELRLGDWSELEPFFDALEARAAAVLSTVDLERWLLDWGELSAAIDEEGAKRYIAMSCHTDSQEAEQAYLQFVEQIEPKTKPRQFQLAVCYCKMASRRGLNPDRYLVFDRGAELQVSLFREANVPLETEEARVGQQYQKLCGGLTVQFQDKELTLVQMGKFLEDPDRSLRESAWRLTAQRRASEQLHFEDQFDELIRLRQQMAQNAGFENYRDYAFKLRGRFDYTPDDCARFHDAIESEILPVIRGLQASRRSNLGLASLRPWDLAVDPASKPALKPFETVDQLVSGCQRVFDRLDPELAAQFKTMRDLRLLDLDNRKGKAPGGYQSTLSESRLPFIFMNSIGVQRDLETLFHEAGHAFHALAARDEELFSYRSAPIEFCEVASMSMELLTADALSEFYVPDEAQRARRDHLEGVVEVFPWIATVDAFQHWVYTNPGHSRQDRAEAWGRIMRRFAGDVDWTGLEHFRSYWWHRQLHIFLYPFYYIEYGIAQLGALQVWDRFRQQPAKALAAYKHALSLGGSRTLPDLFHAAGCEFDFSSKTLRPLMRLIQAELQRLS